jgi:predicted dehydrogenase
MRILILITLFQFLAFGDGSGHDHTHAGLQPLRIGVIGLVHTHVHWILGRESIGDIEIVGIAEPNRALALRYAEQHGYPMSIVFDTMEEMIAATQPEAVTAFNTIYDHLAVVEYCAPRGIHVMVEKPLAASLDHAQKMAALAREHNIHLLTNYETSWYGSNSEAYRIVHEEEAIGDLRKIIFYTGHPGPVEIGCNQEFLEWLTDPVLNGGGALTDFGCYGANLATWFLQGHHPESVTCVTQQVKPHLYPKVEDDATIILTYPSTQVVIMASWNWSHNRKEMEVYGTHGYVFCRDGKAMEVLEDEDEGALIFEAEALPAGNHDPFAYLARVTSGDQVQSFSPSSLDNNLLVMQILEAAKVAAESGETVLWEEMYAD